LISDRLAIPVEEFAAYNGLPVLVVLPFAIGQEVVDDKIRDLVAQAPTGVLVKAEMLSG
jgi:hypothetical protein